MITTSNFKNGLTIELDGGVWSIVEFLHVKPGKGSAFVRTKLKNLVSGNVVEKTFRAGEKVPQAIITRHEMQYLYRAGDDIHVMDTENFDQIALTVAEIGDDKVKYLKEQSIISILKHNDKIIGIDIPMFVELEVVDTPPSEKGNTATGGTKPATTESGAVVMVPFFVNIGDVLRIDTRTNTYLDRVK